MDISILTPLYLYVRARYLKRTNCLPCLQYVYGLPNTASRKKLLKHIEKWGVPYEKYVITYLPSTRFSPSFLYFNTEKYQIRFDSDESSTGGIPNSVKKQFGISL